MAVTVKISIIHYADEDKLWFNDVLALLVKSIRDLTTYPYELNIIDQNMPPLARKDMEEKIPDVDILRNDDRSPSTGANLAARNFDTDYMCLLHTDLLVSWKWLTCVVENLVKAEKHYGVPCVTTFKLLNYPMILDNKPSWDPQLANVRLPDRVGSDMTSWGFPWKMWNGIPIAVSRPGLVTDHGWQIGVYMAGREFFNEVGEKNEALDAYEDLEYGIRVLKTRCRSLISEHVVLHHMGGLHRSIGIWKGGSGTSGFGRSYNAFRDMIGVETMKKMQDGSLWLDLHANQREKYGK